MLFRSCQAPALCGFPDQDFADPFSMRAFQVAGGGERIRLVDKPPASATRADVIGASLSGILGFSVSPFRFCAPVDRS